MDKMNKIVRFDISYLGLLAIITVIWIIVRALVAVRNKKISWAREAKLILVYICIVVIARFVDFPLHHVDGHIAPMKFDSSKILPLWVNLVPFVNLFEVYDGWLVNIIGNITMFIPVGIIWPFCFDKLDSVGKTVLAGFGFTLFIEISQLFFYERCSDVDDLVLNTLGMAIGAVIYFGCRYLITRNRTAGSDI